MPKHAVGYNFSVAMCLLAWTLVLSFLTFSYVDVVKKRGPIIEKLHVKDSDIEIRLEIVEKHVGLK